MAAAGAGAGGGSSGVFDSLWKSLPGGHRTEVPPRQILRLVGTSAQLHTEPDVSSPILVELKQGELIETVAGSLPAATVEEDAAEDVPEWLLVRSPSAEEIEIMSDKPLDYVDGWLHVDAETRRALEPAEHQLGDKIGARIDPPTHPVLDALRRLPPWRAPSGLVKDAKPLPKWMVASVYEIYTGKIEGSVKGGRFLVQRPSGAIPERVAHGPDLLVTPKQRWRKTLWAGLLGLTLSMLIGSCFHAKAWARGVNPNGGRMAWPQLVGWMTIISVFASPMIVGPCYLFVNSQAATVCTVTGLNMLLYVDLFGE